MKRQSKLDALFEFIGLCVGAIILGGSYILLLLVSLLLVLLPLTPFILILAAAIWLIAQVFL